ncbi:hypothetical protein H4R24_004634 [Coemansia sp. RSA 988]|nr:hypothetical protein H4R24_004634 [Coemansia sp. RSA 988]
MATMSGGDNVGDANKGEESAGTSSGSCDSTQRAGEKLEGDAIYESEKVGETDKVPAPADGEQEKKKKQGFFSKYKKGPVKEKTPAVSILQLYRFADRLDKALLTIGMVAACATGVTMPLMTVVFSDLTGEFLSFNFTGGMESEANRQKLDSETRKYCWYFLGLGLATWAVAMLQKLLWGIASERIGKRVRETFYESILRQEIGWFDGLSTGELTTRISGDVNLVQEGIGEKFSFVVQYVTTFVAGVILAFAKGWRLTLVVLAVLPVIAGSASVMGILLAENTSGGQDAYAAAGSVADEVLGSIKTVMAFGGEQREEKRFKEKVELARAAGQRKAWVMGGSMGFIMFSVYSVYALGFWYGGKLVREGRMDAAEVLNAFFALIIGGFSLGNAAPSIAAVGSARGAAVAVYKVIDRKSAIDAVDKEHGCSADDMRGEITFRGVQFAYPTRPEVTVLRGMDMHIKAGQRVALVGESGGGKSTVVGLVARLYDAQQGAVLVDGTDVREYNVCSLRQQMGVIMQTPVLFGQSIHRNIVWGATGDREPTREDVVTACKAANAHEFITALPDGYDTLCGERGALLSGGQKQRIAIARALIRNPRILLLDEATSALDSQSEAAVQQALDTAAHGRTTITVAHRLSTVRDADVIFVLGQGAVVESGSHEQLLALGGAYARLVEAQQLRQSLERDVHKLGGDSASQTSDEDVEADEPAASALKTTTDKKSEANERESVAQRTSEDPSAEDKGADSPNKSTNLTALPRLIAMHRRQALTLAPASILSIVDGASLPCFSVVFARMLVAIANPDSEQQSSDVALYSGLFFMFACVVFLAVGGRCLLFGRAGEQITCLLRGDVFRAMMRQDAAYFDRQENGTGALTARLATEAADINKAVGEAIPAFVAGIASITAGMAIAFVNDWRLTLVILATLPFLILAFYYEGKSVYAATKAMKNAYTKASQEAAETVANIRTVATLTREHSFIAQFRANSQAPYRQALRNHFIASIGYGFAQSTMFLVYCLAFFVGSRFILEGFIDTEAMFSVMYAIVFAAMSLGLMAQQTSVLTKALISAEALFATLQSVPNIDAHSTTGLVRSDVRGDLALDDVRFAYPTRARASILRGVTMAVAPGQTVALVGPSGSGKSTVLALVQRLYDVLAGVVSVDSTSVSEWNVASLRSNLALVGQEPVLFDYSIAENIAYARPDATQLEIEDVARQANIHSFVSELPDGYATRIGQTGGRLSGGQKQRIAIARALIRNPRILLLDEATSALDSQSEAAVQQALDTAANGRTTITIAHRLSTIQNADLILVFRHGRIVEQGTHDQLLALNGLYNLLVTQQSLEITH